jgi:hypothetical protein
MANTDSKVDGKQEMAGFWGMLIAPSTALAYSFLFLIVPFLPAKVISGKSKGSILHGYQRFEF